MGMHGIDMSLDVPSRRLITLCGLLAEEMNSPVDIAVFIPVIGNDPVDHLPRFLGRGGVVEIYQRSVINLLFQDWEIMPDLLNIKSDIWVVPVV
jgi:hypothetical protein